MDAILGSERYESKLSCLINVARANNWRGYGWEAVALSTHHESISLSLCDPGDPPTVFPLFPSRSRSLLLYRSYFTSHSARVISAHEAFDLLFCGDGTIKKYRDDDDAASATGPSFALSNPPSNDDEAHHRLASLCWLSNAADWTADYIGLSGRRSRIVE